MKYKIYRLEYNGEVVYVGYTTLKYLCQRKASGYSFDFWKECKIILIEETTDVGRERFWVEYYTDLGCELYNIHKGNTGLSRDEYNKQYTEYSKEHRKEYKENNKEHLGEMSKVWREKNKEKIKEKKKEWLDNNKNYNKEYYEKTKEIRKSNYDPEKRKERYEREKEMGKIKYDPEKRRERTIKEKLKKDEEKKLL